MKRRRTIMPLKIVALSLALVLGLLPVAGIAAFQSDCSGACCRPAFQPRGSSESPPLAALSSNKACCCSGAFATTCHLGALPAAKTQACLAASAGFETFSPLRGEQSYSSTAATDSALAYSVGKFHKTPLLSPSVPLYLHTLSLLI
jgi:hypothetical protein